VLPDSANYIGQRQVPGFEQTIVPRLGLRCCRGPVELTEVTRTHSPAIAKVAVQPADRSGTRDTSTDRISPALAQVEHAGHLPTDFLVLVSTDPFPIDRQRSHQAQSRRSARGRTHCSSPDTRPGLATPVTWCEGQSIGTPAARTSHGEPMYPAAMRRLHPARPSHARVSDWPADLVHMAASLTKRQVPYCVIGGVALSCWIPSHIPRDLDIVLAPTRAAGRRARIALQDILQITQSSSEQWIVLINEASELAHGRELTLTTPMGSLDLVGDSLPPTCNRACLVRRRQWWTIGGIRVPVCRRQDLLLIKESTGRVRDVRHAELLHAISETGLY